MPAHKRIDEGMTRRPAKHPRKPPAPPERFSGDPNPTKLAGVQTSEILLQYLAGRTSVEIAADYGVTPQGLAFHLRRHAEDDWRECQIIQAFARKERAQAAIESAPDPLSLARAREMLRAAQWDLERLYARLFGVKQEVAVSVSPTLNITAAPQLSHCDTPIIPGEGEQVIDPADDSAS